MKRNIGNMPKEELTDCELIVMQIIWKSEEILSIQEITNKINKTYKKDWKVQTVSTFLGRAVKKGYLEMKRKGRLFFYYPLVTEDTYGKYEIVKCIDIWSGGKFENLVASFVKTGELTREEKEKIRSILDGME